MCCSNETTSPVQDPISETGETPTDKELTTLPASDMQAPNAVEDPAQKAVAPTVKVDYQLLNGVATRKTETSSAPHVFTYFRIPPEPLDPDPPDRKTPTVYWNSSYPRPLASVTETVFWNSSFRDFEALEDAPLRRWEPNARKDSNPPFKPDPAPAPPYPIDRAALEKLLRSRNIAVKEDSGIPVYLHDITDDRLGIFFPHGETCTEAYRVIVSTCIVEAGMIYLATDITVYGYAPWCTVLLTMPSPRRLSQFVERDLHIFSTPYSYYELIRPSLIVGCKARDYDQDGASGRESRVTTTLRTESLLDWSLLSRIYGEPSARVFPAGRSLNAVRIRLKNGDTIRLNPEQSEAAARYNSDAYRGFVVEAPPGSGKTLTAAAMAVVYEGDGVQLFLSTANEPVFGLARALAKLDYGQRRVFHMMSANLESKMEAPFTLRWIMKQNERLSKLLSRFENMEEEADEKEKEWLRKRINHMRYCIKFARYDIIFGTVDMALGRRHRLRKDVKRIVFDEASQLTEAALNALILAFPLAQVVLIGDSKQLHPYKYERGDVISELAARPALDVVKAKGNLPVTKLKLVYRAPQALVNHYSNVFYDGKLKSEEKKSTTNPLACLRQGDNRCLFWKVRGVARQNGTSKTNDEEIECLISIVKKLRDSGVGEDSVMIISYYEAQRRLAAERLEKIQKGYEVLTVDSAQGREKNVVIVLTTRTTRAEDEKEFFASPLRCNVAVSRHKEALIIIGHPTLASSATWAKVLSTKYFKHVTSENCARQCNSESLKPSFFSQNSSRRKTRRSGASRTRK